MNDTTGTATTDSVAANNTATVVIAYPRFDLGRIIITPGALAELKTHYGTGHYGLKVHDLLTQHICGFDGDLSEGDKAANRTAVAEGGRILSAYQVNPDLRLWILTEGVDDEGVRQSTVILLPEEY